MKLVQLLVALTIAFFTGRTTFAQWPTSTYTDSALVINFGFSGRMVTDEDGSSIISHGVDNTVYLQKFDSAGYRVWSGIVVALDNDSSDFGGGARITGDGQGGAVVLWSDHRGAYVDSSSWLYLNNASYMQSVDASGVVLWQEGGVLVSPPDSGFKGGFLVSDGRGGGIQIATENGFGYPGAPERQRLFAARIDRNGVRAWDRTLETSTDPGDLQLQSAVRAGRFVYIDYRDVRQNPFGDDFTWVIDTSGVPPSDSIWSGAFQSVSWRDSILFSIVVRNSTGEIRKLTSFGDTVWSNSFAIPSSGCEGVLPFDFITLVPDNLGGVYYMFVCGDSVWHFHNNGQISRPLFPGIADIGDYVTFAGDGGLVIANDEGIAQRWDSLGVPQWDISPIVYQADPENSLFEDYWGDKNGGIITTFWTTTNGLSAQHTGRYGRPGIVPVEDHDQPIPYAYELAQNFPNPFNPQTIIQYTVPRRTTVKIEVFDILGQKVSTILNQYVESGTHRIMWRPQNLVSAIYYYRFVAGNDFISTKKMLLIR